MIEFAYLYRGLCGMARAHLANAMAGHLGAAVVAGYFVGEVLCELDSRVYLAIAKQLERIVAGEESIWFDSHKTGIHVPSLFEPFPGQPRGRAEISGIATALTANIDQLRQSGHNVIFSSIAIRALCKHPELATDEIVGGIEKLIAKFDGTGPGRGYYGKDRGWISGDMVSQEEQPSFPPYRNQQEMVEVAIEELIRSAGVRRRGFGDLFHIVNHAAALTELSRFGYDELAQRGLAAHHRHVCLWRSLPDVERELGSLVPARHDPRSVQYWQDGDSTQWSAHLTHRVKTIYGFFTLLRSIQSEAKKRRAQKQFLYLMG